MVCEPRTYQQCPDPHRRNKPCLQCHQLVHHHVARALSMPQMACRCPTLGPAGRGTGSGTGAAQTFAHKQAGMRQADDWRVRAPALIMKNAAVFRRDLKGRLTSSGGAELAVPVPHADSPADRGCAAAQ